MTSWDERFKNEIEQRKRLAKRFAPHKFLKKCNLEFQNNKYD
ncbi:MAG: hypothetical protein ACE5KT_08190 [Methanosarcinales archaeon]